MVVIISIASPMKGQDRVRKQGFPDAESGRTRPIMGADIGQGFSPEIAFLFVMKLTSHSTRVGAQ
jgi:hypothetical protein